MSVYVDDAFIPAKLTRWPAKWCHLTADSEQELHAFAARLGLRREWFQPGRFPHYDVTHMKRTEAIRLGAIEETSRGTVRRMAARP